MEKEFVPYEIALALKELGFNEPCIAIYQKNKKLSFSYIGLKGYDYFKNDNCWNFTAPLYQQAFRWFREKYGLHGEISVDYRNKYFFMMCKFVKNRMMDLEDESKYYDTFEEAEKECLNKLIELCKKN